MQMFSFGEGGAKPPQNTMGSAPGLRWGLCPEIPVIPTENFSI